MIISKNKTAAISFALLLIVSMGASTMFVPNTVAHTPAWQIPTYAYIVPTVNPIGVGQPMIIYMWLDPVFGVEPGAGIGGSGALLSNNYRFHNYVLTITAPDGNETKVTFDTITDSTSSQLYHFTPTQVGTYNLTFNYLGQLYNQYPGGYNPASILVNDTYLPSSASATLTVQQEQIPTSASSPLPTSYWQEPIYGENPEWYQVSSNWLGVGAGLFGTPNPPPGGYTSTVLYRADTIGPLTSHIMWTTPTQSGGIVGGNMFPATPGVAYFEGSSYAPRFQNPIIMNGILYYTKVASFTGSPLVGGSATGPTVAVNLRTGVELWSNPNIPVLSFGYIYNVYDPDQHGVYPPVLVATLGGFNPFAPALSTPLTWVLYDGFTGLSLFNVTNVPGGAEAMGPMGEQLQYVFNNVGTPVKPNWYLAQWNSSKLWVYDINPYTGTGSVSPSVVNGSNHLFIGGGNGGILPNPIVGQAGTYPNLTNVQINYGDSILVDADIGIEAGARLGPYNSITTYDWNISVPSLNTMTQPFFGAPVTVDAVNYGDLMLVHSGSLPVGFAGVGGGAPQGPWTFLAINLNASKGAIGTVLWTKTLQPPAGNLTVTFGGADWQTRTFCLGYTETVNWVGYSLTTGEQIWGPTPSETPFDYYGTPGTPTMQAFLAYGKLYSSSFGGICYARDDTTGQLLWTYGNGGAGNSTNAGFNTPYGVYPTFIQAIANGVIYLGTDEHTVTNPIYKGATMRAINATTGSEIWQLSGYPSEWASTGSAFAVADGYMTFFNGYDAQVYSVGKGPSATTISTPDIASPFGTPIVIKGAVTDISAGTKQDQPKANFPNGVPVCSDSIMKEWMGYVYQQQPKPATFTGVPVSIDVLDSNGNFRNIGTATTTASGTYSLNWIPDIPGNYQVTATFAGNNGYWGSSAQTVFDVMQATPTPAPTSAPVQNAATTSDLMIGIAAAVIAIIIAIAIVGLLVLRKRP
ncbi:MAG TPA: PQQ-binding-like beta-propeller repeat protein [Candidatus Binatia bacterium]|nr:PQQ-binding-like beta-propeller repeat protein [Candidatus Binatia bacterium]